ncbi:MAG: HAD family hydrolase [bacterium]|nr:HAD family hydrolase [bacterium]
MESLSIPLIIFDLDETAVHTVDGEHSSRCRTEQLDRHTVLERPFLGELLERLAPSWQVAVWTAGTEDYAEFVADRFFRARCPLEFTWGRRRCTQKYDPELGCNYFIKDLKKAFKRGYRKERVLMVDNTPRKIERQYGNHLRVRAFRGDPADVELKQLIDYLEQLRSRPNFRLVEKRGWNSLT